MADLLQKIIALIAGLFTTASLVATPTPAQKKEIVLTAGGDVMLGRSVMITTLDKSDMLYPFHKIAEEFRAADLALINLENPIITGCQRHIGGFTFCADPRQIEGLNYTGIDVITLANNHTLNYGKKGIEESQQLLAENGFVVTGVGNLATKTINDTSFGFIGLDKSQQVKPVLSADEKRLIEESDPKVDVLIVAMHWGTEYQDKALPGVRDLARQIVSLGADAIIGSHPHWVQDWEMIDGKPVYYSLGNLVFDQMWSEETKKGMVVKLYFENSKFIRDEKLPTYMKLIGQPEFVRE